MNKRGILEIVLSILIVALIIFFWGYAKELGAYGYLGIFVISILSSATIFIPAPGWLSVIALANSHNPLLLGIVAGAGSALGELTGYLGGHGIGKLIGIEKKEFKKYLKWIKKNDALGIMLLSFLPNPLFDVAGIAAGAAKVPLWRYLLFCSMGRIIRYALLAYGISLSILI